MMAQPRSEQDDFQDLLEKLYEQFSPQDPLIKVRSKAWDHFQELGMPSRRDEVFRYIRLRHLFSHSYLQAEENRLTYDDISSQIYPECAGSCIVFVNGYYQASLSRFQQLNPRVIISPLNEAIKTYGTFLNNQWAKTLKEETDPFAALNAALHRQGIFLYIPPKVVVETPIQILNVVSVSSTPSFITPRWHVFFGAQAQAQLINKTVVLSGEHYCFNQVGDFALEEGAQARIMQIANHGLDAAWHFDAIRANLKRDSSFKAINATNGCFTIRPDYRVALVGENAEAHLSGVWMLNNKREAHTHVLVDHQAPFCRSMQMFKGVLDDFSHSSFEGKILVRQPAQKTQAFQLNNNLLLSDRAHADSKPNLEIFADDVKASHGATVGQLDKEQLFYLKARGFSNEQAKSLLILGFCKEVFDQIGIHSVYSELVQDVQSFLKKE